MKKGLRNYFPMIRTKHEILQEIRQKKNLNDLFESWKEEQQKDFLDFTSGMKGVKILYDAFFKEVFNPETKPERLETLLSLLLRQKVMIKCILPGDNSRIADENSLLIMDILVELEDGSLANIECQKIGYKFPGQRSACYSADLLLRQYKRVRDEKGKAFGYKDIKKVFTIVLLEKSTKEFHQFPDNYVHHAKSSTNTGLEIELLQEYVFIPLDIFREKLYNRGIATPLDAWLAFLSVDEPEWIERLVQQYPEFIPLYEDVYAICKNMERVMGIFSEELKILDKNTVQLMIDDMQDEIDGMKKLLGEKDEILTQKDQTITQAKETILKKDEMLNQKDEMLNQKDEKIKQLEKLLEQLS